MAQRAQVPKFGNWESEENVPYTAYFENARKGKKGSNPNDPQENPNEEGDPRRFSDSPSHGNVRPVSGPNGLKPREERRASREEGEVRKRVSESPHHHRSSGLSPGDTPKRVARSDRSIEQSPLHPRSGGRGGVGVSSPSWERKGSYEGGAQGQAPLTPGRSRLRSVTRGDDAPDQSPAVPKFGDWDESDPASAEGYTHIFNRVREEKQTGAAKVPVMPTENSYSNGQKRYGNDNLKSCWCFPWGRK